jgi:hypothetical protein
MANCWRCGGQISSYASRCTWCGRSTSVSAFLQVIAFGVLIVAALFVGGLLPIDALTRYLPSNWLKESPLPPRSAEAAEGSGGGGAQASGGGYGTVAVPAGPADEPRAAARAAERQRREQDESPASRSDCDSEARINLLAVRYGDWSREDLALIACRRLRDGFSADQVVAARGRPQRRTSPGGQTTMEVWVYRDMRVVLDGGRVVSIREP